MIHLHDVFLVKKVQKWLTKIKILFMFSYRKLPLPVWNAMSRETLPVDVNDVLVRENLIETDLIDYPFVCIFYSSLFLVLCAKERGE